MVFSRPAALIPGRAAAVTRRRALAAALAGALACSLAGAAPAAAAGPGPTAGPAPAPRPAAAAGAHDAIGGAQLASPAVVWSRTPGVPAPPANGAQSWLLADLGSGDVLAARSAHARLRPASTQKILTALTLLPQLDPATVYQAQWGDAAVEGSKVGMVPGATYTVAQMWQALFLVSGNDAATGLANAAGGTARTVDAMRAVAHDLQARDTSLLNVTGLDAPGQVSSAYDLALFARAGLARDDFRALCTTVKAQFPGKPAPAGKARPSFQIYTQDKLVLNYRGAIGVKTGFTTLARSTFVGAATRNGHTLVVTLMHTGAHSWKEAAALLDWGFAHESALSPVGSLVDPLSTGSSSSGSDAAASAAAVLRHPSSARLQHAGLPLGSLPWWAWLLLLIVCTVAALRTRVLLLRSRRRRRLGAEAGLIRLGRPS